VLVAINTRLSTEEIRYILDHSGCRLLVVDAALFPMVAPVAGELKTVEEIITVIDPVNPGDGTGSGVTYDDLLARGNDDDLPWTVDDEEGTISINYTSGTTGRPKGVMYTHRGAYLNALMEALESHVRPDSVQLWVVPMFHCNGWCFTWAVTAMGARHVCLRKVEPAAIWELIDREGITHYNAAPTVHLGVVTHPAAHRLERELTATIGGAPPSPTLLARMVALNFRPVHVYGMTETYAPYTVSEPQEAWAQLDDDDRAALLGRQGVHNIVSDPIRVVDDDMHDVPRDGETMGEVVMRGNNVMKGYFDAPEATEAAFKGGWFHSGDIGVIHPDGYIEIRDRKKDIIISGGENISTIEVENTICRHPAVLECAVIAVPHEKWGERPKAFVTLRADAGATEREIIDFCRERLAHFKAPDAVEFGELPKTSTGKVQKYVLREREWSGRAARVN
jgi:fatty-acyl-CoA synthase